MLLTLFILIVSLALLVKGSDVVVDEIAALAATLRISPFIIGLTVIAIGTSFPELATNVFSVFAGTPEIGLGNVLGSNIYNLGFNLALGLFLLTVPFQRRYFLDDAIILLIITSLFLILALDGQLSSSEGVAFLFLFACYFIYQMKTSPRRVVREIQTYTEEMEHPLLSPSFFSSLAYLTLGLVALIFGAHYLISSVLTLSVELGLSGKLISMTLVAFGTALPELFVTINATRKGLVDVFLGNIIGSNAANILLILGISSVLGPLSFSSFDLFFSIPLLLFLTLLLVHYLMSKQTSSFFTGFILFFTYGLFLFSLFFFAGVV
ncbi:MAG: calcium/sodium antiporter [Candidatus Woesearchaeota archaeon]|nr:calcium/sodium antiporter [Candidatus Woesearchaeota archaeon]